MLALALIAAAGAAYFMMSQLGNQEPADDTDDTDDSGGGSSEGDWNFSIAADFETVWDKGHTQAERTGSSDTNFIEWVNSLW